MLRYTYMHGMHGLPSIVFVCLITAIYVTDESPQSRASI